MAAALLPLPAVAQTTALPPGSDRPAVPGPTRPPAEEQLPPRTRGNGRGWPVWATVAGAAAVAALGASIGIGAWASSAYDEYRTTRDNARYWELRQVINERELASNLCLGASAILAIAAAMLYVTVDRRPRPARALAIEAWLVPAAGGVGVVFR